MIYENICKLAKEHTKNECELFFRKGIETYSDMDGEVLIKGIQERVRREYNEQRAAK